MSVGTEACVIAGLQHARGEILRRAWSATAWAGPTTLVLAILSAACGQEENASLASDFGEIRQARFCSRVPAQGDGCTVARSAHALLGMAVDDDTSDDYWMEKDGFVLSYNPEKNVANWVSWRLDSEDMGSVERSGRFHVDDTLPRGFFRVSKDDYTLSGFDRGHLCPSKERTRTAEENASTFLMTNIHPQVSALNTGPWKQLEEYEQARAERDEADLYIVAGPIFQADLTTIGRGVAVPSASFRIVVELPHGAALSDVDAKTPVIAVIMPNSPRVAGHSWRDYVTSVDEIEQETGYDFLPALPASVETSLEREVADQGS